MVLSGVNHRLAGRLNLFSLFAAIVALCAFPQEKEIWYDETVSMLISKGIGHDTPTRFAKTDSTSAATLQQLNAPRNVYRATVKDMGNSFPYNMALHWFTRQFGNSINVYTLFSRLCGVATVIAFYSLAKLLFGGSVFTSLAIILLATDPTFVLLSYEIRAYSMGTLFIVLGGIYLYRFMYLNRRPLELFVAGLLCAAAVLTHFLSVYVILVFAAWIVLTARARLLSWRSLTATAVPILLVAAYVYLSFGVFANMRIENEAIRGRMETPFALSEVLYRSAQLMASDFRVVFSAFRSTGPLILFSFLLVLILYVGAVRVATDRDRKRLHLLFALGASGTVLFAFLSVTAGHYSFLYHRYHSFGIPFACLFTAYAIGVLVGNPTARRPLQVAGLCVVILPCIALYASLIRNYRPPQRYSHVVVAREIASDGIGRVVVPEWRDAFLLHALLPNGHQIRYVRNERLPHFVLVDAQGRSMVRARIRL